MDSGRELVKIDPDLYRPLDMDLLGDPTHAVDVLGWRAKTDLKDLAGIMAAWDLQEARAARLND
jgi:GDPmannose 4,6-dehydratase